MELIAYIVALVIYFNIFGSGILFLEFIRLEISGVWHSVRRPSKRKKRIYRKAN
jgi:hypothetical protein